MSAILDEAYEQFKYTQSIRRDLHQHPELAFNEVRTAKKISDELSKLNLDVSTGIGKTGVVAILEGNHPGPTVLIWADIDAVEIQEETELEFASQIEGVMHACAHDAHTAIALTVARILAEKRDEINGTVKFVFQPAEEIGRGAKMMIKDGVLENPRPDYVLGVHIGNERDPVGRISATPGILLCSATTFRICIQGEGEYGATPHLARDPIVASAALITALQSIVSRNIDPMKLGVLTVLSINSIAKSQDITQIPSEVVITGMIRALEHEVRDTILERIEEIADGVCRGLGCTAKFEIENMVPAVVNDAQLTQLIIDVAKSIFPDPVIDQSAQFFGADDIALFMQEIPGCFIMIDGRNTEKGQDLPLHDPRFDFDEEAMVYGVALLAAAGLKLLKNE